MVNALREAEPRMVLLTLSWGFSFLELSRSAKEKPSNSIYFLARTRSIKLTRQLEEPIKGTPPQEDGFVQALPDPNRFEMRLDPDGEGRLVGEHVTLRANQLRSRGRVICERLLTL